MKAKNYMLIFLLGLSGSIAPFYAQGHLCSLQGSLVIQNETNVSQKPEVRTTPYTFTTDHPVSAWSMQEKKEEARKIRTFIETRLLKDPRMIGSLVTPFIEYARNPQAQYLIDAMYYKTPIGKKMKYQMHALKGNNLPEKLEKIQALLAGCIMDAMVSLSDEAICDLLAKFYGNWYIQKAPMYQQTPLRTTAVLPIRFEKDFNGIMEEIPQATVIEYLIYSAWLQQQGVGLFSPTIIDGYLVDLDDTYVYSEMLLQKESFKKSIAAYSDPAK